MEFSSFLYSHFIKLKALYNKLLFSLKSEIKNDSYPRTIEISQNRVINFASLERQIQYKIKNNKFFIEALTHRSFLQNYNHSKLKSNERLEYLGDSVLNLIVGNYLFKFYSKAEEGKLTKIRSRLVNRKALYEYSKKVDLINYILINPNAIISYPKGIESILADAFESLIAAVFLDGGYKASCDFITNFILSDPKIMQRALLDDNYKSAILEYAQSLGLGSPRYQTIQEEGPNHDPVFTVQVYVGDDVFGIGKGRNKKEAEQEAAKDALIKHSLI